MLSFLEGDTEFAMKCHDAFLEGQVALDLFLWNETAQYYNAYTTLNFDYERFVNATNLEVCDISGDGAPAVDGERGAQDEKDPSGRTCLEGDPATPGAIMADSFYAQVGNTAVGIRAGWFN